MSQAWSFALGRLIAAIAIAVGLGLIFGRIGLWLTIVLGGLLTLQLVNLFRLQRWLQHRSEEVPPDLGGVWGDVVALIGRIYRRKQFHKRRVTQLFREFRRLTAALPDGVVLLSPGHEIIWFNRTAAVLLGLQRSADRGMPIENLIRQPEFSTYLKEPGGGAGVVVRMQGGEKSLMLIVIPAGGQLLMLVRDVTREARLEQMRKDFVANASHELRSPLTVISGYLDQLGEEAEPRRGMARADCRHAPAGGAHARNRRRPAGTFAHGVERGRGADAASRHARNARAPGARSARVGGRATALRAGHPVAKGSARAASANCTRSRRT